MRRYLSILLFIGLGFGYQNKEPRIDATSDESLAASTLKIQESLTKDEVTSFTEAIQIISFNLLFSGGLNAKDIDKVFKESLHGKTGTQIIEEAARIKKKNNQKKNESRLTDKIREIRNWYTTDIWNKGIVQISWYISTGTSASGRKIDMEYTLRGYRKKFPKISDYNKYIINLDKNIYNDLIYSWEKMYQELLNINNWIEDNEIKPNHRYSNKFSTDLLHQYVQGFYDAYDELE